MNIELIMIGHAAIIFQRLSASRLFIEGRHGKITDFEQFGRCEKHHVRGVIVDGIHHAALFKQDRAHPALLQFDSAGQTRRSGANHHHVVALHG